MSLSLFILGIFCLSQITECVNPWEPQPGDANWHKIHERLLKQTADHKNDIKAVFLGASITQFWQNEGKPVWNEHYANRGAYDYGISGDTIQNVIWRVQHKELDGTNPKVLVILLGSNNVHPKTPAQPTDEDIAHGFGGLVSELRLKLPNTKIILMGITPILNDVLAKRVNAINELMEKDADNKHVFYLNINSHLVDSQGLALMPGIFRKGDDRHFTVEGYKIWDQAMRPLFDKLYDSKPENVTTNTTPKPTANTTGKPTANTTANTTAKPTANTTAKPTANA